MDLTLISPVIIQAIITILISVIIFFFTTILKIVYIDPYFRLKKNLRLSLTTLYKYNHIFTNAWASDNVNERFRDKVLSAQDEIRQRWAEFLVSLKDIRYTKNKLVNRMFKNKVPTEEEIEKIAKTLIFIFNSSILYYKQNAPEDISKECLERDDKIREIIQIMLKY